MGVILNNLIPIIGSSIAMSIPLVLASVGGAFSVRSGIMALGLESMMMMGAFFGVLGSYFTGSVLFGFLLGMVGGMVIGLFHGILSVRYKVNQVISGIGLNLLALAVTTLLMQLIWNNKGSTPQVASISTPDARTLVIQPWDGTLLKAVEKALLASELGINPQNDGKVIRLIFPQLTEERRKDLTKQVRKYGEEGKVALRNIRRDAMDDFKKKKKASEITEDDLKELEKELQDLTDKRCKDIDELTAKKEQELMAV